MLKFMILFRPPEDADSYENVFQDFLALVERMPNIRRRQVAHVTGSPLGAPEWHRILEIYFETAEARTEALMSPVGQEAGTELQRLPAGSFQLLFADSYEEEGGGESARAAAEDERPGADETVSDSVSPSSAV